MFFNENVTLLHIDARTDEEVIRLAAGELYRRGIVKDTFCENALKREEEFPTGLYTGDLNVAIPHTDSEHVNRSQIAFISLKNPVDFRAMDDDSVKVPVSLAFMIAMKHKHEQTDTLSALMGLFQKQDVLWQLWKCETPEAFREIINANDLK